ncbi:hypothetical protein [Maribellus sediminis]|uniref:hypothetical protein n=1 Tax=Maribellus sediminis TaxID=2696285 RepID=UPI00142FCEB1|nr:hypothetical protein [Maribellus sediminis]
MTKTLKILLLIVSFVLVCAKGFTQNYPSSIDTAFQSFSQRPPAEKLYLQTDRDSYSTGGTIWFKGYLVSASGNLPTALSRFIYVELYDQSDKLVCRKKIKKIDGIFSGNIKLDKELPEGSYFVRAYSTWMLNSGLDFVFHKAIFIGDLMAQRINAQIKVVRNESGKKSVILSFHDKNGEPVESTKINCEVYSANAKIQELKRQTDGNGQISFDIAEKGDSSAGRFVEVTFQDSPVEYNTKFEIDTDSDDVDIQFFPEGGELLQGVGNRIAFKAIGNDGYSKEVSGTVLNSTNDTLATFRSQHLGMGSFYLIPREGENYHAVIKDKYDNTFSVDLPEPISGGAALTIAQNRYSVMLNIRKQNVEAVGAYFLLAHSGEKLLFAEKLTKTFYKIPNENLSEGIVHFVLLNEQKEAISSRLVFIKKETKPNLLVQPDKENYKRREKISLAVSFEQYDELPRQGDFSIAVTDDLVVDIDSLSNNICSGLLLCSDLKGYIEKPGFYFLNDADSTNFYLDLVMLTHGWERFNINDVLKENLPKPEHYLELGQTISGKYEKRLLQRNKTTEITALSFDPVISASATAQENGNFLFNELDFPDSTTFTVHAQRYTNVKQEPAGIITFDMDTFPPFVHKGIGPEKQNRIEEETLKNATDRMYYEDGGKMIFLDEVKVRAADKTNRELEIKYGMSGDVYDAESIARKFPVSQSMDIVIRTFPGVANIDDGEIYLTRGKGPAELYIDGMELTFEDLRGLYSEDIAHIAVIVGPGAAVYSRRSGGDGGVVIINLKEGAQFEYKLKGIGKITPLGYQKPVEFYVPKYEVDSVRMSIQPDMRATVYWEPKVKLRTEEASTISFYAADPKTTYTYIIEGTTNWGEVCRFVGKIRRKEK